MIEANMSINHLEELITVIVNWKESIIIIFSVWPAIDNKGTPNRGEFETPLCSAKCKGAEGTLNVTQRTGSSLACPTLGYRTGGLLCPCRYRGSSCRCWWKREEDSVTTFTTAKLHRKRKHVEAYLTQNLKTLSLCRIFTNKVRGQRR